ncbi:VWA domain-containing protein [Orbaceae bacterium ESL0721]|nr:VWA domain-containing protein [Orbaceae bacterium ESL0721]
MQRITRVAIDSTDNNKLKLLTQYNQLLSILRPILTDRTFSFFAKPKLIDNGNYVGWYSDLEGQPILLSEIADSTYKESIEQILKARIAEIERAIKTQMSSVSAFEQLLALIKDHSRQIYVINGDPVIVINFAAHAESNPLPTINPKTFWNSFRIALLALFLLALLGLLWYLFCPWGKESAPEPAVISPVVASTLEEKPEPEKVVDHLPVPLSDPLSATLPIPKAKPVNDPNCITKDQLAKNRNPPRLVIALDDSESMKMIAKGSNISRFAAAKEAINAIIDKVEPNIEISIIQLHSNEGKKINIPFYSLEDREILKTRVNNFKTVNYGSDTFEYDGLNQLAERFGENSKKQKYYTLVVTDGEEICTCHCRSVLIPDYTYSNLIDTKVINITGNEIVNCVFQDGLYGKLYTANTANEITKQINKAVENMKITRPVCVE